MSGRGGGRGGADDVWNVSSRAVWTAARTASARPRATVSRGRAIETRTRRESAEPLGVAGTRVTGPAVGPSRRGQLPDRLTAAPSLRQIGAGRSGGNLGADGAAFPDSHRTELARGEPRPGIAQGSLAGDPRGRRARPRRRRHPVERLGVPGAPPGGRPRRAGRPGADWARCARRRPSPEDGRAGRPQLSPSSAARCGGHRRAADSLLVAGVRPRLDLRRPLAAGLLAKRARHGVHGARSSDHRAPLPTLATPHSAAAAPARVSGRARVRARTPSAVHRIIRSRRSSVNETPKPLPRPAMLKARKYPPSGTPGAPGIAKPRNLIPVPNASMTRASVNETSTCSQ